MLHRFDKLFFIDLETTGPDPAKDLITEIGIVEMSRGGISHWSALVNPQVPIPPFIQQLTGISDEMVCQAPTFAMLQDEVRARLRGGLVIAHNARFDYGFLRNAFKRAGTHFRGDVLCTLKLSRKLFPQEFRHGLDALIERHGLSTDARHRALGDADLLWQFWRRLEQTVPPGQLLDAVEQLLQRPNLPAALEPEELDDLPDGPGVYVFYGESGLALQVGRASNLRQQVLAHFPCGRTSPRDTELAGRIRRLEWFATLSDIGAQLRQHALMRSLRPQHDPPHEQEVYAWCLQPEEPGRVRPVLLASGKHDFGAESPLYGLFASPDKARAALAAMCRKLADAGDRRQLEKALAGIRLQPWPYPGPVLMVEQGIPRNGYGNAIGGLAVDMHLIDNWHYLGSARSPQEVPALLAGAPAHSRFNADVYRLLQRALAAGHLKTTPPHAAAQVPCST